MAQFIKIYENNPNEVAIKKVVEVLKNGGLVIYPTDTVYGLGCDITNTKALERIAKIKGVKLEKANFSFITRGCCRRFIVSNSKNARTDKGIPPNVV
jgi:tRNA A37 threonylcarbamoyladenosine synthetase subunit TsaC/SUA5/YrdC